MQFCNELPSAGDQYVEIRSDVVTIRAKARKSNISRDGILGKHEENTTNTIFRDAPTCAPVTNCQSISWDIWDTLTL